MQRFKTPLQILVFGIIPVVVVLFLFGRTLREEEPPEPEVATARPEAPAETAAEADPEAEPAPAPPPPPEPPPIRVAVASKALAEGHVLKRKDVEVATLDPDKRTEDAIIVPEGEDAKWLIGKMLTARIEPGAPIRTTDLHDADQPGFIGNVLSPGTRATTIHVNSANRDASVVEPGNHVDAMVTIKREKYDGGEERHTGTLARNLRVIAVNRTLLGQPPDKDERATATVTLETTPEISEMLTLAESVGDISLSIRPPDGEMQVARFPIRTSTTEDLIGPAPSPPEPQKAEPVVIEEPETPPLPPPVETPPPPPTITIWRGEERTVEDWPYGSEPGGREEGR